MPPWLKAGLIGAFVLLVLNVIGVVPCVGCFTLILGILAYAGIGALAAYYLPPTREAGTAAWQGALAAVIAALVGGIVQTIIVTIRMAVTDSAAAFSQMPPEVLQQMQEMGLDATTMGPTFGLLGGGICCGSGVLLAIILGAIGGAIFAAAKPE